MENGSKNVPLRRLLNWVLHPLVLLFLFTVTAYSNWFRGTSATKLATGAIGAVLIALLARYYYAARSIERAMEKVEQERDRVWSPEIDWERTQLHQAADSTAKSKFVDITIPSTKLPVSPSGGQTTIYVRGIQLENIRCFRRFGLALEDEQGPYLTTILLGDNAAGKSTALRSIALGLCPESDAIALIKQLPGSLLRKGATQGSIVLHVRSSDRKFEGTIRTTIEYDASGREVIRQITEPTNFPWEQIFVCGYGTHRSAGRPSSHETYSAREAVGTLFSDVADLLNPEVVFLRRDEKTRKRLEGILKQILLLENIESGIRASDRGIELGGPWGSQPLAAVSDGYRSTSHWVLDFLGWQLFGDRLSQGQMGGLLLIDELEQHLHPRWQRHLVQRLRAQLGQTQVIASTHTPLLAAGVADVNRSQVVRLIPMADGSVETLEIPRGELTGKRADQILADAFGLITSKSPGSVAKIDRYTELLSRARSESEDKEVETLKGELENTWSSGDSAVSRAADKVVSKVLDEMIEESRDVVDAQVKQRLHDLFASKK